MTSFIDYPGDFRLQIWRLGNTVQNLESPRLSGRVDSPEVCSGATSRKQTMSTVSKPVQSTYSTVDTLVRVVHRDQ